MEKTVFAQRGPESVGKTTTIRLAFTMLVEKYRQAVVTKLLDNDKDLRAIIAINGRKIGIESYGDPWKKDGRLKPSLSLFHEQGCDWIFCACRTAGGTVEEVEMMELRGYAVVWRDRSRQSRGAQMDAVNRAEATWLLQQVSSSLTP